MPTILDTSGLDRISEGLRKLGDPDATDLMVTWMNVIDDDNRKGILAGLDKDGVPMAPVTYRPRAYSPIKRLKPTKEQRLGQRANAKRGAYIFGSRLAEEGYGNLTSAEYRMLGGPPLAPRGQFSRVVTNLKTTYGRTGPLDMQWYAAGYWDEVLDRQGKPFLQYHFNGSTGGGKRRNVTLPKRDLRGVRPGGIEKAMKAMAAWARLLLRQAFG